MASGGRVHANYAVLERQKTANRASILTFIGNNENILRRIVWKKEDLTVSLNNDIRKK